MPGGSSCELAKQFSPLADIYLERFRHADSHQDWESAIKLWGMAAGLSMSGLDWDLFYTITKKWGIEEAKDEDWLAEAKVYGDGAVVMRVRANAVRYKEHRLLVKYAQEFAMKAALAYARSKHLEDAVCIIEPHIAISLCEKLLSYSPKLEALKGYGTNGSLRPLSNYRGQYFNLRNL